MKQWVAKLISKKFNKHYNDDLRYKPEKQWSARDKKVHIKNPSLPKGLRQISPNNVNSAKWEQHFKGLPKLYKDIITTGTKAAFERHYKELRPVYDTKNDKIVLFDINSRKVLSKKEIIAKTKSLSKYEYNQYRKDTFLLRPEKAVADELGSFTQRFNKTLRQEQSMVNNAFTNLNRNFTQLLYNIETLYNSDDTYFDVYDSLKKDQYGNDIDTNASYLELFQAMQDNLSVVDMYQQFLTKRELKNLTQMKAGLDTLIGTLTKLQGTALNTKSFKGIAKSALGFHKTFASKTTQSISQSEILSVFKKGK